MDRWRTSEELLIRVQTPEAGSDRFAFARSNMCYFEMDKPTPAGRTISLEFIPQQPVHFEFLIQPPQP